MGAVTGSLKLGNVWKVIREVDLDAIRREALAPIDLVVLGEPQQAERMRAALSPSPGPGGAPSPHRYIRVNPPGGGPTVPNAVIVVAPPGPRSTDLDSTLRYLVDRRIPHALAIVDDGVAVEAAAAQAAATLVAELPDAERLAFAHQLPPFRAPLFERIIEDTARANASFAFTSGLAEAVPILTAPLNLGDMIVLTKNQLLMGYRLVLAGGRDGEPKKLIGEILGVLGGGLVFRQLARQLVGLIPVVGILPEGRRRLWRHLGDWTGRGAVGDRGPHRVLRGAAHVQPRGPRARPGRGPGHQRTGQGRGRQGERTLGLAALARARAAPARPGAGPDRRGVAGGPTARPAAAPPALHPRAA